MPAGRNGIRKILEGIIQSQMGNPPVVKPVKMFPRHVMVNCVDPRIDPSRYAQLSMSEKFNIRNAGNLFPHSSYVTAGTAASEPATLELAFTKFNTVKQVAVCGHSDCKAMSFLYGLKDDPTMFKSDVGAKPTVCDNPLRTWIRIHGAKSLAHFLRLQHRQFSTPLIVSAESPVYKLEAWIDPENNYEEIDKLAMVNALVQMENVASYNFMKTRLESGTHLLHALWFDVKKNSVMVFSRSEKRFIPCEDASTVDLLVKEATETISKAKAIKANVERKSIEAAIEATREQSSQCDEYRNYTTMDYLQCNVDEWIRLFVDEYRNYMTMDKMKPE